MLPLSSLHNVSSPGRGGFTRALLLALATLSLTACQHREHDAPLAFVPTDTPYVLANLRPLGSAERKAVLARLDAELPARLAQLRAVAGSEANSAPAQARLLTSLAKALDGKTAEDFAREAGIDLSGHAAFYGLGLAPVLRFELSDPKAFAHLLDKLQHAYGSALQQTSFDGQSYRWSSLANSGTELLLAVVERQAVLAILPAHPDARLLRQVLGLKLPPASLLTGGMLTQLAHDRGYQPWLLGRIDSQHLLALLTDNHEPLLHALLATYARPTAIRTGEPIARLIAIPSSCSRDAERIANRIGDLSLGYTRLDPRHQDWRWHLSLASDLLSSLQRWSLDLPGLREPLQASLDLRVALPISDFRSLLDAQAQAIQAQPFTCPVLTDLNALAERMDLLSRQLAIPPIIDLRGLRLAIHSLHIIPGSDALPRIDGQLILASEHPESLLATAQLFIPPMNDFQPAATDQAAPLPPSLKRLLGQEAWLAMDPHALAIGFGQQAVQSLGIALTAGHPREDSQGELLHLHFDGPMYRQWQRYIDNDAGRSEAGTAAATSHRILPSFATQALNYLGLASPPAAAAAGGDHLQAYDVLWHMDADGLNIDNRTTLLP